MSNRFPPPDQIPAPGSAEYVALYTSASRSPAAAERVVLNDPPAPATPAFPPPAAHAEPHSAADHAAAKELWRMVLGELTGFDLLPQARQLPIEAKFTHPDGKPDVAQHRRFDELRLALEDRDAPFDGRAVTLREIEKFLTDRNHGRKVNGRTVISDPELAALLRAAGYEKTGQRDGYGTPLWAQKAFQQDAAGPSLGSA